MRPFQITRSGVAGTLLALVAAATCIRLGIWQLDRLDQRRTRNAAVAERIAAEPITLTSIRPDTVGMIFRTVIVEGEFDHDRTIIWRNRTYNGVPGVQVLTPLRVPGSHTAVLVDLGWLPAPDASTADLDPIDRPPTGRVTGLVIPLEDGDDETTARAAGDPLARGAARIVWTRLELAGIARQMPYPIAPFYVQALPEPGTPQTRLPARIPPPRLDEGSHLGYAIQWFGFATVALVGWVIVALRRSNAEPRARAPDPLPDREAR